LNKARKSKRIEEAARIAAETKEAAEAYFDRKYQEAEKARKAGEARNKKRLEKAAKANERGFVDKRIVSEQRDLALTALEVDWR